MRKLIAAEEKGIKKLKEAEPIAILAGFSFPLLTEREGFVKKLKVVRARFVATPTCEEKWTLVGTEPDRNKAEIWATHMRERGETVKIEGDKVYIMSSPLIVQE